MFTFAGNIMKQAKKYYGFDVDDNLLHLDTVIHLEKYDNGVWEHVSVTTAEYAFIRNNENYRVCEDSFAKFSGDMFVDDINTAIKNKKYGPSWNAFIECVTGGHIFCIITARKLEAQELREGVENMIRSFSREQQNKLFLNVCKKLSFYSDICNTEEVSSYLDNCDFYGVSGDGFVEKHGAMDIQDAKKIALNEFIEKNHINENYSIGFSDDDPHNVEHIHTFLKEKSALYNNVNMAVYDSGNGIKTMYKAGMKESNMPYGMESSVVPFSKFNSLTNKMFPDSPSKMVSQKNQQDKLSLAMELTEPIIKKKKRKKKTKKIVLEV